MEWLGEQIRKGCERKPKIRVIYGVFYDVINKIVKHMEGKAYILNLLI